MNNSFSIPILAEKLSKLNNSQQSIESLSLWCIVHRKRAKHVVETWGKLFNSSQKEQRVSFLYLANDILQNSRRKGSEFVNEFWKVLPGSLKLVYENGDDQGKNVVMRLVAIWNERNVFGSRGQGLKDDILAKGPPCLLDNNGMNSNPIKVVKKDAHTIRIKLSVGGMPEKIVTAYQSLGDEHFDEDTSLNKCKDVVGDVGKMEIDVNNACTRGIQQGSSLMGEIQEQETILNQCIEQLESVEASRTALVAQLREALKEQEPKLELIHSQLQVARAEKEHIISMKQRLASTTPVNNPNLNPPITTSEDSEPATEPKPPPLPPSPLNPSTLAPPQSSHSFANALSYPLPPSSLNPLNVPPPSPPVISFINSLTPIPPPQPPQHLTSFANCSSSEEENKKAAAAVAARLASSTSSAQMLTSVLSSLAAEEAATMNSGGLSSGAFSTIFSPEKRRKLENPYYGHGSFPPLPQMSPANQPPPPPFPRPPPLPPAVQQFVGVGPFSFGANGLPPPPLMSMGLPQSSPPPPPLPPPHQQQHSTASGYYETPRIGFYGKLQMGTPQPPLPPQGSIASQGSST